jgi:hypothetical protein
MTPASRRLHALFSSFPPTLAVQRPRASLVGGALSGSRLLGRPLSDFLLTTLVAIVAFCGCFFSEKIKENNGFGFDGVRYGAWARNLPDAFRQGLRIYDVERVLPSALVYGALQALRVTSTEGHVIRAFGMLNAGLLTLAAWLWCLIAARLGISARGKCLGFLGFFCNFAMLKWAPYTPVLTDVTGFALGMGMVYCHLERRTIALLLVTVASAFTWPTAIYFGVILLLFPKTPSALSTGERGAGLPEFRDETVPRTPAPYYLNWIIPAALAVLFVCYVYYLQKSHYSLKQVGLQPFFDVLQLSIATAALYLVGCLASLLNDASLLNLVWLARRLDRKMLLVVMPGFFAIKYIQHLLSNGESGTSFGDAVAVTVFTSISRPAVFYLAHVIFYGPLFLVAPFVWRQVCKLIQAESTGLSLCAVLGVVLSLLSESRCLINLVPFFVPFIVKATERLTWRSSQYGFLTIIALLISKVWLRINSSPLTGDVLKVPDQYYYMSHGPFMSNEMYLLQGGAVLLAGLAVYVVCIRDRRYDRLGSSEL